MTTHAAAGKQWTREELDELVVENNFRMRGLESTRLDTFVDAAFAFVLTILVISFDDIPSDYAEMIVAVQRIPGFAMSFAVLMMFWLQHRKWSRRYGLENSTTIIYSLALIFVVLVYVYPLRMIFEGMFSQLSGGRLASSYSITSYDELRMIFVFYSTGFAAMSFLVHQLYRMAMREAESLALNQIERRWTSISMRVWLVATAYGLLSIVLALTLPEVLVVVAGYMYFVLIPLMWIPAYLDRRRYASAD